MNLTSPPSLAPPAWCQSFINDSMILGHWGEYRMCAQLLVKFFFVL
jgi:hypothetical protein